MQNPKSIKLDPSKNTFPYLIPGQGVFIFELVENKHSHFIINNDMMDDGLKVSILNDQIVVNRIGILEPMTDPFNEDGFSLVKGSYYWFSLDPMNQRLYFGIGEARLETATYQYIYHFELERDDLRKNNKQFLESLTTIKTNDNIIPLRLLRDPITTSIPLKVKNTDLLTMNDIASAQYMPKANLSITSQRLYDCIAGEKFVLNDDDFPNFSNAIEQSIRNPEGWCYKKLQSKSREFNKDKPNLLETYLRITLGENNGESPGIPYVMEIWPPSHYSPIHNHANAEAVIRVLTGNINVSLYPFLCADNIKPFNAVTFEKDDVTWISSNLNQTHQLRNLSEETTCVTIQCYMYKSHMDSHYDYFDYIDGNGDIQQYEPDSDMDFIDFKKVMKQEWEQNNKPRYCCF